MTHRDPRLQFGRRDALRLGALTVSGTAIAGSLLATHPVAAHPKPEDHEVRWGDDIDYLAGSVRTYATLSPDGELSSLGVYVDEDALSVFDEDSLEAHLDLPTDLDTQFTFVGFDYTPAGHPPPDIYTVPHFDIHFYLTPAEAVEAIVGGPATYDIPEAQIPPDYERLPAIDTDDDGEPDTPAVEPHMGEHLGDTSAPEFQGEPFTHTMIYGYHDDDGDGTGRLTFLEPMVTLEFLREIDEPVAVDVKTPAEYPVAGSYPTQYAIKPAVTGGVYVSIDGFQDVPGSGESMEG